MRGGIGTRLKALERRRKVEASGRTRFRLFDYGELVPCDREPNCHIELATGEHHRDVISLDFRADSDAS